MALLSEAMLVKVLTSLDLVMFSRQEARGEVRDTYPELSLAQVEQVLDRVYGPTKPLP